MIAAGLAPAAAAHVTRGSAATVVTHYKGTAGVARMVPRTARHATGATRMLQRGSRLSGHIFSPTERVPHASAPATPHAAANTLTTLSNFNGTSSRDSEF